MSDFEAQMIANRIKELTGVELMPAILKLVLSEHLKRMAAYDHDEAMGRHI